MASIRERTSKAGITTFSVQFRHGSKQTSETFRSSSEAEDFKQLVEILGPDKALKVLHESTEQAGITVQELADQYLDWKAGKVTERTITDYQRDVTNWIIPTFGHRAADYIDEGDVQAWVDKMARTLSPKTVGDKHMLLHSIYKFGRAKSRGLVDHNPCEETELPDRGQKQPPKGTTVPEFRALLAAAAQHPDAQDLILFLGETGWRFSEATALTLRDVEDDGQNVWVEVTQVFRIDKRGIQYIAEGAAKTAAGFRRVRLFPASAAMVRRRMVGKGVKDFVFTNSHGNHWNQNTFLRETWPRIVKRAELGDDRKPTPHWLRHMHVAVLLAAGVPMHEVQRRIGHEHYSTTVDVYGGLIGDLSDDAMVSAAALMSGQKFAPSIAPAVVRGELA